MTCPVVDKTLYVHRMQSSTVLVTHRDTGMYYGGDPPAWTTQPEMPPEALYKAPKAESKSGQGAFWACLSSFITTRCK